MQTATRPTVETGNPQIIDCDSQPHRPNNWEIEDHKQHGKFEWNPHRIKLHLSQSQQKGRSVQGDYLEYETIHLNVANANLLNFLGKNLDKIPRNFFPSGDAFSQSNVFWGTRYKNGNGKRFVGCLLCFQDGTALVSYSPIDHGFCGSDPAVIFE